MNPRDALSLPLLTVLNIHPLRRRQGLLVQRNELVDALRDLGLKSIALPKRKLINAKIIERLLHKAGLTIEEIKRATSFSTWAQKSHDLYARDREGPGGSDLTIG